MAIYSKKTLPWQRNAAQKYSLLFTFDFRVQIPAKTNHTIPKIAILRCHSQKPTSKTKGFPLRVFPMPFVSDSYLKL